MGVVSAHAARNLYAKTVELEAKRTVQGSWRFMQVKVLVARMANNQLPPCTLI